MDVIIWAIILGAVFYINKKSKSAGSKNTQPNKPRPQQKQIQQIWNSMQNTVQSGMNALNQRNRPWKCGGGLHLYHKAGR